MTNIYIGTKQIEARPEARGGQEGYEVVYPDGYQSWSPKEAFESAYLLQGADPSRITEQMVAEFIVSYEVTRLRNHTVVCAVLRNGFSIVADSACVDPANYHEGIGTDLALNKIKNKVWELLGFMLCSARNGVNAEGQA